MNILMRYLGYILLISSLFRLVPIIAGMVYGEAVLPFVLSALLSIAIGLFLLWMERNHNPDRSPFSLQQLSMADAFVLSTLSFVLVSLIGALSFLPSFNYHYLNALFESTSGFTTTGLTLYSSLEGLPRSLLLWRATTQWIGGIGIIMVFLVLISRLRFYGHEEDTQIQAMASLYQAQGFQDRMEPNLERSTRSVLFIYCGYTLLGFLLLHLSGKSIFEALSLSFTALSTGGFLVSDRLDATGFQLGILSVLMLVGAISFISHDQLLKRRFKDFFSAWELRTYMIVVAVAAGSMLLFTSAHRFVFFDVISAFTSTGFALNPISTLPSLVIAVLLAGMVLGGCLSSTAGGVKVSRVFTLFRIVPWILRKISSPRHAIIPFTIGNKTADEEDVLIVVAFVVAYLSILLGGALFFVFLGYGLFDSFFQVVSALGTVGLQSIDLMSVPGIGKIFLICAMLLGRLEIFPVLILIRRIARWGSRAVP